MMAFFGPVVSLGVGQVVLGGYVVLVSVAAFFGWRGQR